MIRGALESRGHGSALTAPGPRFADPAAVRFLRECRSVASNGANRPSHQGASPRSPPSPGSGVAARELCRNSAVEYRCGNRPEIGHAPLDDCHPWCSRFVACPSFRCGRPGEIWSGRGTGSRGGIFRGDIRRLPPFLQAPSPKRIASIGRSPQRRRCAPRTARCGRRTSTRGKRRSRTDGISRPAASAVLA